MSTKFFLLFVSALLYSMPFYYGFVWWLIFFFPIPLFYTAYTHTLSFKEGYFWGFFTFFFHMVGMLWSLAHMSAYPFIFCVIPFIFCVFYQGLYAGIWFWLMQHVQQWFTIQRDSLLYAILWIFGIWLYFYWIEHYCLICFDYWEGYILMHPLIPLMRCRFLANSITYIGKEMMIIMLYAWSAACALYSVRRDRVLWIIICFINAWWLLFCVFSYYFFVANTTTQMTKPLWFCRLCSFVHYNTCTSHAYMSARILSEEIKQLLEQLPEVDVVIMPESAIVDGIVFEEYAHLFSEQHLQKPIHLIAGSFYKDQINYFNTCYWVHNGNVRIRYDKRHTMPLTERIPSICNHPYIYDLYFSNAQCIDRATNVRPVLQISDNMHMVPYICSELFFNAEPDADNTSNPIVALINDKWCMAIYLRRLMVQVAQLKAILWQRDIIYVSYYYALWCTKNGIIYPLQTDITHDPFFF